MAGDFVGDEKGHVPINYSRVGQGSHVLFYRSADSDDLGIRRNWKEWLRDKTGFFDNFLLRFILGISIALFVFCFIVAIISVLALIGTPFAVFLFTLLPLAVGASLLSLEVGLLIASLIIGLTGLALCFPMVATMRAKTRVMPEEKGRASTNRWLSTKVNTLINFLYHKVADMMCGQYTYTLTKAVGILLGACRVFLDTIFGGFMLVSRLGDMLISLPGMSLDYALFGDKFIFNVLFAVPGFILGGVVGAVLGLVVAPIMSVAYLVMRIHFVATTDEPILLSDRNLDERWSFGELRGNMHVLSAAVEDLDPSFVEVVYEKGCAFFVGDKKSSGDGTDAHKLEGVGRLGRF